VDHRRGEWTALHAAAAGGRADCVAALLALGANSTAATAAGYTPLHAAAAAEDDAGGAECAAALAAAGADPRARNADGDAPLHRAAANTRIAAARRLLALGADVAARNREGRTAADEAARTADVLSDLLNVSAAAAAGPAAAAEPGDDWGRREAEEGLRRARLLAEMLYCDAPPSVPRARRCARGSTPWFYTVVLHRGFTPWFYTVVLHRGFTPWFYTVVLHRVRLDSALGCVVCAMSETPGRVIGVCGPPHERGRESCERE
jgi:hypothetical protein